MRTAKRIFILTALAAAGAMAASKQDSGWVPVFNGADFNGFYVFQGQIGYTDVAKQSIFKIDSGMIHVNGSYALLTTNKEYRFYRMRVDYRFTTAGGSKNAGMMVLMDNEQAKTITKVRRPRSIEVNFLMSAPLSLWASENVGPYITTTVKTGTQIYTPADQGGTLWTCEAWDPNLREIKNPTPSPVNPVGQWNHAEADMFGDSGVFILNGQEVTRGWKFQDRGTPTDPTPAKRVRVAGGGVAVQSEGQEIWYKNWDIMEIDSATHLPVANAIRPQTRLARKDRAATWLRAYRADGRLILAGSPSRAQRLQTPWNRYFLRENAGP